MQVDTVTTISIINVSNIISWYVLLLWRNSYNMPNILPKVAKECIFSIHVILSIVVVGSFSWVTQVQVECDFAYFQVPCCCDAFCSYWVYKRRWLKVCYLGASLVPPLSEAECFVVCSRKILSVILLINIFGIYVISKYLYIIFIVSPRRNKFVLTHSFVITILKDHQWCISQKVVKISMNCPLSLEHLQILVVTWFGNVFNVVHGLQINLGTRSSSSFQCVGIEFWKLKMGINHSRRWNRCCKQWLMLLCYPSRNCTSIRPTNDHPPQTWLTWNIFLTIFNAIFFISCWNKVHKICNCVTRA